MPSRSETANVIARMGRAHQGVKAGRYRIYGGPVFTYFLFSPMNHSLSLSVEPQGLEQHVFTVGLMSFPRGKSGYNYLWASKGPQYINRCTVCPWYKSFMEIRRQLGEKKCLQWLLRRAKMIKMLRNIVNRRT